MKYPSLLDRVFLRAHPPMVPYLLKVDGREKEEASTMPVGQQLHLLLLAKYLMLPARMVAEQGLEFSQELFSAVHALQPLPEADPAVRNFLRVYSHQFCLSCKTFRPVTSTDFCTISCGCIVFQENIFKGLFCYTNYSVQNHAIDAIQKMWWEANHHLQYQSDSGIELLTYHLLRCGATYTTEK